MTNDSYGKREINPTGIEGKLLSYAWAVRGPRGISINLFGSRYFHALRGRPRERTGNCLRMLAETSCRRAVITGVAPARATPIPDLRTLPHVFISPKTLSIFSSSSLGRPYCAPSLNISAHADTSGLLYCSKVTLPRHS